MNGEELCAALVGRAAETSAVSDFLHRSSVRGGTLVIVSDAGIGKTTMLRVASDVATTAGHQVLTASGIEFEAELPYSALHQAVRSLLPQADALPATMREALMVALGFSSGPAPSALALGNAVLELLYQAARTRPLVVLVDDLHWLDRSSAAVLSFIAHRLSDGPVALVAGMRDQPTFFDVTGHEVMRLLPIGADASATLVRERFPQLTGRILARILDEAKGNPLALLELSAAAASGDTDALADSLSLPTNSRLRALFEGQVDALKASPAYSLLVAALEGTGRLEVLDAASPSFRSGGDLAALEKAGLLQLDSRLRVVFRHPLIRSVVVDRATVDERHAAHAALAACFHHDPDRRSWHLAMSTTRPDEQVAATLERTGRRTLRKGDGIGAVKALLRAADLSPNAADRARRLAEAAYVGADVTGDLDRVAELLDEAVGYDSSVLSRSLPSAAAAAYAVLNGDGDIESAHHLLAETLHSSIETASDEDALGEALLMLLSVCLWTVDPDRFDDLRNLVDRSGRRLREDLRLEMELIADPVRTATGESLAELDTVIGSLDEETDLVRIERTARAGTYVDRVAACREPLWRVVRDGRSGGAVATAVNALMHLCIDAFRAGRWDEAQQLAEEGSALCTAHGYRLPESAFRLGQGLVAAATGDHDLAAAMADETLRWAAPRGIRGVQLFAWHIRGLSALSRTDDDAAYEHLSLISPAGSLPPLVAYALWVPFDLVEAASRAGHAADAQAHVAALRKAGVADISVRARFIVRCCEAVASTGEAMRGAFEAALGDPARDRAPFELGRLHLLYGERLRRSRQTAEARPHLQAAADKLRTLGALPWATRAEQELRASGIARVANPAYDALTVQESEIASLAASGLTNKQIGSSLYLSHRTVAAHLRSIFTKLGITSRAALRDALTHSTSGS